MMICLLILELKIKRSFKMVSIGDPITFNSWFEEFPNNCVMVKL